jgi:outer membrane receptor protein involved in Fe transport
MTLDRPRRALAALLVLVVFAVPSGAQTGAVVTGKVVDETGAALPGAIVTLSGPAGTKTTTTGPDGTYRITGVAPGEYKLTITLTSFSTLTQDVSVREAGTVQVPSSTLGLALRGEEIVVSASRTETALVNAPATMSVITTETIARSPAQNFGDLLRTVPGANVIQMSARDINITTRQGTSTLANSQLALLDGRSIYLDFFGLVLWDWVPATASDIKQIEVVRGPASAVWGANALTGVINIITKTPREAVGTYLTLTGGTFDRKGGSRESEGNGTAYGASASVARAPNDRFSYRLSGGYYNSDPFSRPVGTVPVGHHPLDASLRTGGAPYPVDQAGSIGNFRNSGTSQPKLDGRVDQELSNGGRMTYSAGWAASKGIIHTGIGPFDIENGSYMGYGKVGYSKAALKVNAFVNLVDAKAPNLLLLDPATGAPVRLNFKSQTYDLEAGHSTVLGGKHVLTYGGNARRNNFDITLTPNGKDRNEFGAYLQDEFFVDKFRLAIGGRVDKFGNIDKAVFSPRVTAMFKPTPAHSLRVSFNRAFRSPSVINNYLDQNIFAPPALCCAPLRALVPLAQLLAPALVPFFSAPPPLVVRNIGNPNLKEESLNAYEAAYLGTFEGRTTVGFAVYQNDKIRDINFTRLTPSAENPRGLPGFDVYTPANPPPGFPAAAIAFLAAVPAQFGGPIVLPRTVSTYLNLSGTRQRGVEVSIDHSFNSRVSAFANYSFQDTPEKRAAKAGEITTPTGEIGIPPRNRYNVGVNFDSGRFLGSAMVNHADKAFWTDVLTSEYDGYSPAYTMLNATVGAKWANGKVTTSLKGTNLTNEKIQQHTFGDIIKRSVFAEVRLRY